MRKLVRGRISLRDNRDNKDILVRLLDLDLALTRLLWEHPDEARAVVVCGLFQMQFREAEVLIGTDHVTIHEWFTSGVAHLANYLNGA